MPITPTGYPWVSCGRDPNRNLLEVSHRLWAAIRNTATSQNHIILNTGVSKPFEFSLGCVLVRHDGWSGLLGIVTRDEIPCTRLVMKMMIVVVAAVVAGSFLVSQETSE